MKKTLWLKLALVMFICSITGISARAEIGDIGYFGGVSEGTNLPKSIEKYVPVKPVTTRILRYKEIVYISGEPVTVTGNMTITKKTDDVKIKPSGSYTEKYVIKAENIQKKASLNRTIQFNTSFHVVDGTFKKQIIRNSAVTSWKEDIEVDGVTYTLNSGLSTFSLSSVEDLTPGVSYYKTNINSVAQYLSSSNQEVVIKNDGAVFGYNQPWSKVEAGELTMDVIRDDWQMQILLNPSLEAKKTLYFDKNTPYPISFDGTYNQRLERDSSLKYRINTYHPELTDSQIENSVRIVTANEMENLIIPGGLDFLKGHGAEEDIKQLYSLEVFTELPHRGMELEAMYRGEYVKAICIAMNIDISKYISTTSSKNRPIVFADVPPEHPLYPYIMAAYDAKLINGIGDIFNVGEPIQRQEAFAIYIRVIGLERLGVLNTVTPFKDDHLISEWSRQAIQAGYKLGIIQGDGTGKVNPKGWLSKVDAGSLINRLIKFLREDITESFRKLDPS